MKRIHLFLLLLITCAVLTVTAQRKAESLKQKLSYEFESIPFFSRSDSLLQFLQQSPKQFETRIKKNPKNKQIDEMQAQINPERKPRSLSNDPVFSWRSNVRQKAGDSTFIFPSVISISRNFHNERLARGKFASCHRLFSKHFSRKKRPRIRNGNYGLYTETIYYYCNKKDPKPFMEITLIVNEEEHLYSQYLSLFR